MSNVADQNVLMVCLFVFSLQIRLILIFAGLFAWLEFGRLKLRTVVYGTFPTCLTLIPTSLKLNNGTGLFHGGKNFAISGQLKLLVEDLK